MKEPHNSYKITFVEHPHYLYVRIKAEFADPPLISAYMHEIADRCHATGQRRVLFERDVRQEISTFDRFKVAEEAVQTARRIRFAIVNKHPDLDKDLGFAVTVANNRGGMFGLFDNVPEAEAWLLDSMSIMPETPVVVVPTTELSRLPVGSVR